LPAVCDSVPIPRLELVVEAEGGRHQDRRVIEQGELCRIGSNASNDLVLADPLVSQFHCRLRMAEGTWRVVDLGSRNGTRVDGVRVRDADLPLPECRIEIGNSVLRVRQLGAVERDDVPDVDRFGALVGASLPMRRLFATLERLARTDATVLLEGESGTGKEVIATELVQRGPRADAPLVIVDCGAISPSLVESELFGHMRGAFTGADRDRIGAFEAANGGTVFLDEIGELPLALQPKLLRALEAREIRRVGDTRTRKVDVRVIAATNRTLEVEVNQRRFREDLYFRLSVVTVRVPPLRERIADLPLLVDAFLDQLGARSAAGLFTPEVLDEMARCDWPGNVRELRNYIERAVVLRTTKPAKQSGTHRIQRMAPPEIDLDTPFKAAKEAVVEAFDRAYLTALIGWSSGNITQAARRAGMDRIHLHRLLQRYGLSPSRR
ncbi:MAG TPA: sigma 54-interacting transcriptional regulator, partial [Minicystis sp.]|nr:sigma 54-interacting transcriptional regulator [Minicystis sp.]